MTLLAPGVVWRPVVNHGGLMGPSQGLVVHVQEGDGDVWGWFDSPAARASSHWWVSKTGVLEQYVSADTVAWAEVAGNSGYHSVETEGEDNEPLTAAQVAAIARLYAWGAKAFGWPDQTCDHGGRGLTTHAHYPSGVPDPAWGGHPCPGPLRAAALPAILEQAFAVPEPPVPPAVVNNYPALEGPVPSIIAKLPIGPAGEGWGIFDGGKNTDPGSASLSPAIPFDKFVSATAWSDDPVHDHPDTATPVIGIQDRNGYLYLKATGAPASSATPVAYIAFTA